MNKLNGQLIQPVSRLRLFFTGAHFCAELASVPINKAVTTSAGLARSVMTRANTAGADAFAKLGRLGASLTTWANPILKEGIEFGQEMANESLGKPVGVILTTMKEIFSTIPAILTTVKDEIFSTIPPSVLYHQHRETMQSRMGSDFVDLYIFLSEWLYLPVTELLIENVPDHLKTYLPKGVDLEECWHAITSEIFAHLACEVSEHKKKTPQLQNQSSLIALLSFLTQKVKESIPKNFESNMVQLKEEKENLFIKIGDSFSLVLNDMPASDKESLEKKLSNLFLMKDGDQIVKYFNKLKNEYKRFGYPGNNVEIDESFQRLNVLETESKIAFSEISKALISCLIPSSNVVGTVFSIFRHRGILRICNSRVLSTIENHLSEFLREWYSFSAVDSAQESRWKRALGYYFKDQEIPSILSHSSSVLALMVRNFLLNTHSASPFTEMIFCENEVSDFGKHSFQWNVQSLQDQIQTVLYSNDPQVNELTKFVKSLFDHFVLGFVAESVPRLLGSETKDDPSQVISVIIEKLKMRFVDKPQPMTNQEWECLSKEFAFSLSLPPVFRDLVQKRIKICGEQATQKMLEYGDAVRKLSEMKTATESELHKFPYGNTLLYLAKNISQWIVGEKPLDFQTLNEKFDLSETAEKLSTQYLPEVLNDEKFKAWFDTNIHQVGSKQEDFKKFVQETINIALCKVFISFVKAHIKDGKIELSELIKTVFLQFSEGFLSHKKRIRELKRKKEILEQTVNVHSNFLQEKDLLVFDQFREVYASSPDQANNLKLDSADLVGVVQKYKSLKRCEREIQRLEQELQSHSGEVKISATYDETKKQELIKAVRINEEIEKLRTEQNALRRQLSSKKVEDSKEKASLDRLDHFYANLCSLEISIRSLKKKNQKIEEEYLKTFSSSPASHDQSPQKGDTGTTIIDRFISGNIFLSSREKFFSRMHQAEQLYHEKYFHMSPSDALKALKNEMVFMKRIRDAQGLEPSSEEKWTSYGLLRDLLEREDNGMPFFEWYTLEQTLKRIENEKAYLEKQVENEKNLHTGLSKEICDIKTHLFEQTQQIQIFEEQFQQNLISFQELVDNILRFLGLDAEDEIKFPDILQRQAAAFLKQNTDLLASALFKEVSPVLMTLYEAETNDGKIVDLSHGKQTVSGLVDSFASQVKTRAAKILLDYHNIASRMIKVIYQGDELDDTSKLEKVKDLEQNLPQCLMKKGRQCIAESMLYLAFKGKSSEGGLNFPEKEILFKDEQAKKSAISLLHKLIRSREEMTADKIRQHIGNYVKDCSKPDYSYLLDQLNRLILDCGKISLTSVDLFEIWKSTCASSDELEDEGISLKEVIETAIRKEGIVEDIKISLISAEEFAELMVDGQLPRANELRAYLVQETQNMLQTGNENLEHFASFLGLFAHGATLKLFVRIGETFTEKLKQIEEKQSTILEMITEKLEELAKSSTDMENAGSPAEVANKLIDQILSDVIILRSEEDLTTLPPLFRDFLYKKLLINAHMYLTPFIVPIIEREKLKKEIDYKSGSSFFRLLSSALSRDIFKMLLPMVQETQALAKEMLEILSQKNFFDEKKVEELSGMIEMLDMIKTEKTDPEFLAKKMLSILFKGQDVRPEQVKVFAQRIESFKNDSVQGSLERCNTYKAAQEICKMFDESKVWEPVHESSGKAKDKKLSHHKREIVLSGMLGMLRIILKDRQLKTNHIRDPKKLAGKVLESLFGHGWFGDDQVNKLSQSIEERYDNKLSAATEPKECAREMIHTLFEEQIEALTREISDLSARTHHYEELAKEILYDLYGENQYSEANIKKLAKVLIHLVKTDKPRKENEIKAFAKEMLEGLGEGKASEEQIQHVAEEIKKIEEANPCDNSKGEVQDYKKIAKEIVVCLRGCAEIEGDEDEELLQKISDKIMFVETQCRLKNETLVSAYEKVMKKHFSEDEKKSYKELLKRHGLKEKILKVRCSPKDIVTQMRTFIDIDDDLTETIAKELQIFLHGSRLNEGSASYQHVTKFFGYYIEGILLNLFKNIAEKNPPQREEDAIKDSFVVISEKLKKFIFDGSPRLLSGAREQLSGESQGSPNPVVEGPSQHVGDSASKRILQPSLEQSPVLDSMSRRFLPRTERFQKPDCIDELSDMVMRTIFAIDSPESLKGVPDIFQGRLYDWLKTNIQRFFRDIKRDFDTLDSRNPSLIDVKAISKKFDGDTVAVPGKTNLETLCDDTSKKLMGLIPHLLAEVVDPQKNSDPYGSVATSRALSKVMKNLQMKKFEIAHCLFCHDSHEQFMNILNSTFEIFNDSERFKEKRDSITEKVSNALIRPITYVCDKIDAFEERHRKETTQKLMRGFLNFSTLHFRHLNEAKKLAKARENQEGAICHEDFLKATKENLHPAVLTQPMRYEKTLARILGVVFAQGCILSPEEKKDLKEKIYRLIEETVRLEREKIQTIDLQRFCDSLEQLSCNGKGLDPETVQILRRSFDSGYDLRDLMRQEMAAHEEQQSTHFYRKAAKNLIHLLFPHKEKDLTFVSEDLREITWEFINKTGFEMMLPIITETVLEPSMINLMVFNSLDTLKEKLNQPVVPTTVDPDDKPDEMDEVIGNLVLEVIQFSELPGWIQTLMKNSEGDLKVSLKRSLGSTLRHQFDDHFIRDKLRISIASAVGRTETGEPVIKHRVVPTPDTAIEKLPKVSRELVDASISYYVRSSWKEAQDKFDAAIAKLFGEKGCHIKEALDKVFRFIFFEILGRAILFCLNRECVKEILYKLIDLDGSRDRLLEVFRKIPKDSPTPGSTYVQMHEDWLFNMCDYAMETVCNAISEEPESVQEESDEGSEISSETASTVAGS